MGDNVPSQTLNLIRRLWDIEKTLTGRDIKDGQVIIPKAKAEAYIIPLLARDKQDLVRNGERSSITVRDDDTGGDCSLILWKNGCDSYVLTEGWKKHFVKRRELRVNENVGFWWDKGHEVLRFSVLSRPPSPYQEE